MTKKSDVFYLSIIGILLFGPIGWYTYSFLASRHLASALVSSDVQRTYADVQTQVGFGARLPGTEGHAKGLRLESKFIPEYKHSMLDDHTPFLEAGILAADIIDFDYPYWHSVHDTPDKGSAASLQAVGEALPIWVLQQNGQP